MWPVFPLPRVPRPVNRWRPPLKLPKPNPLPGPPRPTAPARCAWRWCKSLPGWGTAAHNLALHHEQIAAARAQGADLIVFPELSLTGYFLRDMVPDVALRLGRRRDRRNWPQAAGPASLVLGFVEESPRHMFYNSALLAEAGQVRHVHRKVYLPTYGHVRGAALFCRRQSPARLSTRRDWAAWACWSARTFGISRPSTIMQAEEVDVLICIANSPARGVDAEQVRTAEDLSSRWQKPTPNCSVRS